MQGWLWDGGSVFTKPKDNTQREKQETNRQQHYKCPLSPVADDHRAEFGCRNQRLRNAIIGRGPGACLHDTFFR